MTPAERQQKLEIYGNGYAILAEAVKQLPREAWHFRPTEGWTIHEIIIHIADSETNSYVRCRRLVAEPGSQVLGYDETLWAKALDYHQQSPEDALELFKWLRKKSYDLIKDKVDSLLLHTIQHSENGPMTFDDWLVTYADHIPDHVAQMQRAYAEWKAAQ